MLDVGALCCFLTFSSDGLLLVLFLLLVVVEELSELSELLSFKWSLFVQRAEGC